MPLQKMIGNIYSVIVEICLWLIPIIGAIGGCIAGKEMLGVNAFLGLILGLIVGIILDLAFFGPVILLLNIRASVKNMENK